MPAGFIPFVAVNIQDVSGAALAAGTLLIQPTDGNNLPITARAGGAGGQMVGKVIWPIAAGSVGTQSIADVSETSPAWISYRITVLDPQGHILAIYKGVQPTGSSFNFDTYVPLVAAQEVIQTGPAGPAGIPGASPLIDTVTAVNYQLSVVGGSLSVSPANVLADTVTGTCYQIAVTSGAVTITAIGSTPGAVAAIGFIDPVTGEIYALSMVNGTETLTLL